MIGLEATETK